MPTSLPPLPYHIGPGAEIEKSEAPSGVRDVSRLCRGSILLLVLVATCLAGYLAFVSLTSGHVAGCDGGESLVDCDSALASRWGYIGPIPVAVPGFSLYVTLLIALVFASSRAQWQVRQIAWASTLALSIAVAGVGVWFTALQIFDPSVGGLCLYCLAIHACAIATAMLVLMARPLSLRWSATSTGVGLAMLLGFVSAQWIVPPSSGHEIVHHVNEGDGSDVLLLTEVDDADRSAGVSPGSHHRSSDVEAPRPTRMISVLDGKAEIDVYDFPLLGQPTADHIVVELFDYTCPACRKMYSRIEAARDRYGPQIAFLVLPTPMNSGCNGAILSTAPLHNDACVLARLALSVWQVRPEEFASFHEQMMQGEKPLSIPEATVLAEQLAGSSPIREQMAGWRIHVKLRQCVELYDRSERGRIPQMLFLQNSLRGELSDEKLFQELEIELDIAPLLP